MKLHISNLGPVKDADIKFGDLTILTGPQASGKTLVLQILKLILDKDFIIQDLEKYGYNVQPNQLLNIFLGEGMGEIWTPGTGVELNNTSFLKDDLINASNIAQEKLYYIPAQRILSVADGRPRNFMEFDNTNPYTIRHFSESIRLLMQNGLGDNNIIFPITTRLKHPVIKALNKSIFHDSKIILEEREGQKKMRMKLGDTSIPFMTWSAGQKEFTPLLMGLYCVSGPPNKIVNKDGVEYVIIEEPEMGLHPGAVISIMLQVLLLIKSGKKVIISTHSPVPLEFAWAYDYIRQSKLQRKERLIGKLFGIEGEESTKIFRGLTELDVRTYYFQRQEQGVVARNITELNVGADEDYMSEWGGLTSFSSVANGVVSQIVTNEQ